MNAELSGISGITRRGAHTPRSPAVGYARGTLSGSRVSGEDADNHPRDRYAPGDDAL